jgi:D-aspartate ligase
MKLFIIHARRTGYGVIRSLAAFSPEVFIADTHRTPVFRSRYITKSYLINDITRVKEDSFLQEMIALAEDMNYQEEKPIVFTGKDDYLLFFSKNSSVLSKYFELSFETDFGILEAALNKKALIQYAEEAGVAIPRSFSDDHNLHEVTRESSWPLIIKPAIKNRPERDVVKDAFRLRVCHNEQELNDAIALLKGIAQPYVIQEYIPGDDSELYTIGTYSWRGELKAWSTSKKLRQFPPGTGECSFGVTLYEPVLAEAAAKLLKRIGLTGISQIEFKKHEGQFYLIEVNPRVWSWHQIHVAVGVNLDKITVDHLSGVAHGGVIEPTEETRYWMFLTMDTLHNVILNKNITPLTLLRDLLRSRIEAFWDHKDPKPFFVHLHETIKYMRSVIAEQGR